MSNNGVRKVVWSEVPKENLTPTISRQVVTGAQAMVGAITLQKGSHVPKHSHESEQLTYVLEGTLRFMIQGQKIMVSAGEILVIPAWVEHEATAVEHTVELDIFSPIRKDWLDGTDTYFQTGAAQSVTGKG
ncbi:MAG: cupin domain-containing protein [Vicinamibacteria bacterium]|nr:cupin domain-containing protein [Vicinamibacteria bacterium]